jgi:hypothetical protein
MWSSDSDRELPVAAASSANADSSSSLSSTDATPPPPSSNNRRRHRNKTKKSSSPGASTSPAREAEDVWRGAQWQAAWPGRQKPVVLAEDCDGVGRSRSLTGDDLEELKGCADLGFGFSYDEIPELRDTLPALELCYSMSQRQQPAGPEDAADPAPPVTNWKISSPGKPTQPVHATEPLLPPPPPRSEEKPNFSSLSFLTHAIDLPLAPGDSPDEVKARLKYWAQAVACTVRLCS